MTQFRCYGNDGSDLGNVHALPPLSFSQFVTETLGQPILLNTTRAEFHALPKKTRDVIKRVNYVTPATFTGIRSRRVYEQAEVCHLVFLDIDVDYVGNTTEVKAIPAKPFYDAPDTLYHLLAPFSFACYLTANSTPELPRLRIVVHADGLPLSLYGKAVATVASRLGLDSVTPESNVAVQPMYLPTMFRDDDPLGDGQYHPVIASTAQGSPLTVADLADVDVKTIKNSKATSFNVEGDDLDYLRPVVAEVTVEDIKGALEKLDPDMVYNEWLEVAAALRHQFPMEPEASAAYELFDQWSQKGSKYTDSSETEEKWSSLKPNPRGRAPVTIRTLLMKATTAGWEPAKLATKCYKTTLEWLMDNSREGAELMGEGIKRIAATPMLGALERGSLLSSLQDALKAKGYKTLRADLKKELANLERSSNKLLTPTVTPDDKLPTWARGFCYVLESNTFFHRATGREMKAEVLDNCYGAMMMTESRANGKPECAPSDFLLNVATIPRVDNFRYDPAHPDQTFISEGKKRFVNIYLPTFPEPDLSTSKECGELFQEHVAKLILEPEYARVLIDWMAYQVQNPGLKIRWAVLLQGAMGCGKTLIAEAMRSILGAGNVVMMDASLMLRDMFNGWAMGSQLVAVEEIRVVGHNRHEVMNRLKPCISNDHISVRLHYQGAIQVPNNTNYIMFTNHHDSLAVTDGDRRYFVVNSAFQNKAQVLSLGEAYFDKLFHMIHTNPGGLRAWLEEWPISKEFKPHGHAPVTKYLSELSRASASPLTTAIVDIIGDSLHPLIKTDLLSSSPLGLLLEQRNLPKFTDQNVSSVLRELDYVHVGRFRIGDDRQNLWAKRGSLFEDVEIAVETAKQRLADGPITDASGEPLPFENLLG
jgi:Primase C terminal 2 (PriCT-2)/Family of unknown function (DUF5906)